LLKYIKMIDITSNIREIQDRIKAAADRAGRSSSDITLIAVSKTKAPDLIEAAYLSGQRVFGENRVQEITAKFDPRPHEDIELHMIGTLQSNKVRPAVACSDWIQSIDREKILMTVSRAASELGRSLNICIEVNTSGESSKHGLTDTDELMLLAEKAMTLPGLRLRGLMTIGPLLSEGADDVRRAFVSLRHMHEDVARRLAPPEWDSLSMGMSNDFELAIAEGATMVRVGTALFGARDYGGQS
jgi:pyridoxal phosphate enzyme (YggS family)